MRDEQTLTTWALQGFHVGDRIFMSGFTGRFRHRIGAIKSECQALIVTHVVPSRGYRKHVRREKAAARKFSHA